MLHRHSCPFGNNVKQNFVLSTKSKQIEDVQFVSTLLKGQNFMINSFNVVADFGNKVECCFNEVECCFDIVACCFNIVACVHGDLDLISNFSSFH